MGFRIVTRGKHIGMSDGTYRITIPNHKRLNPYTLKAIIKDAGLTDKEFKKLL
ncbi:MAG TPA: type II toxin-antitoxin system HicA family toxin [Nitrospirae bacterium]|nr:type II toxin-antitoxin system HicA family toxin [Nitrospirota bacterium]